MKGNIELWKEKSLVGKFMGVCPKERDLVRWINSVWNPTGHYDLQLGSKRFFTIIFFNQEDRDHILEGGAYLFLSTRLYLRPWKERFNLEQEDMSVVKCGSGFIRCRVSIGSQKSCDLSAILWEILSRHCNKPNKGGIPLLPDLGLYGSVS